MKIYDLSLEIYPGMPVFPNTPPVDIKLTHNIQDDTFRMGQLIINSHAGTHSDAPNHFLEEGAGIEGIKLDNYVGPALVIDCTNKKPKEPIVISDLLPYAASIKKGARVLIRTDWDKYFGQDKYFTDYPPISLELAEWLVERGVILLGIDQASLNPEKYIEVHRTLLGGGVVVIEALANMDRLEKKEIFLVGAPVLFRGADGMPLRAMAIDFSI